MNYELIGKIAVVCDNNKIPLTTQQIITLTKGIDEIYMFAPLPESMARAIIYDKNGAVVSGQRAVARLRAGKKPRAADSYADVDFTFINGTGADWAVIANIADEKNANAA